MAPYYDPKPSVMSASLEIDHVVASLCQVSGVTDADLRSTAIATLLVAVGGAIVGLVFVYFRALLARLLPPLRRVSPDDTVPMRALRPAAAPRTLPREALPLPKAPPWLEQGPLGGAGESWLRAYLEKLNRVLPGIHELPEEDPARPGDQAQEVPCLPSPDATLRMDAPTLACMMDIVELGPAPLVWQDVQAPRSPDRTVKMAALTLGREPNVSAASKTPVVEMEPSRELANFQYGARRA
jgi:hypothetical protein